MMDDGRNYARGPVNNTTVEPTPPPRCRVCGKPLTYAGWHKDLALELHHTAEPEERRVSGERRKLNVGYGWECFTGEHEGGCCYACDHDCSSPCICNYSRRISDRRKAGKL